MSKGIDIVVIGSGFGGSVCAARLAEAGFPVTLLERGPWRDTVPVRSMGIASRSPFPRGWQLPTRLLRAVGANWFPGSRVRLNKHGLFELFFAKGATIACSSNVGGGSHVYSAVNVRPLAQQFWEGHNAAISDHVMSGHYDAVLERMGSVTPMADHRIPNTSAARYKDNPVLEAAAPPPDPRLGYLLPEDPDNPTKITDENGIERFEVDYRGNDDGFLGSPKGGKTTLDTVYLAPALKRGLQVRDMAEVTAIVRLGSAPDSRYRIEYIDHHGGGRSSITASHVILAAGTMNTLRILLHSRDVIGGLTGMPQLGKRFGTNGDYFGIWDYNDPKVDHSIGLPTTGGVRPRGDDTAPMIGGGGLPSVDSYPLPKALRERLKRAAFIAGLGEDELCGEVCLRGGKLHIEYDAARSSIFERIRTTFEKMAAATGRKIYAPKTPVTVHPLGGACLGNSIEDGVVGADGQVFDNPGLYVADAAALPRSPGGPPSMTIAAWSDHLASEFIARHRDQMPRS